MAHLYPIGATVTCNVIAGQYASKTDQFTIEAQMPPLGSSPQYRIKSESEMFRRVVAEHQLTVPGASVQVVSVANALDYASEEE